MERVFQPLFSFCLFQYNTLRKIERRRHADFQIDNQQYIPGQITDQIGCQVVNVKRPACQRQLQAFDSQKEQQGSPGFCSHAPEVKQQGIGNECQAIADQIGPDIGAVVPLVKKPAEVKIDTLTLALEEKCGDHQNDIYQRCDDPHRLVKFLEDQRSEHGKDRAGQDQYRCDRCDWREVGRAEILDESDQRRSCEESQSQG